MNLIIIILLYCSVFKSVDLIPHKAPIQLTSLLISHFSVVKALLDRKPSLLTSRQSNDQYNGLHYATFNESDEVVAFLLTKVFINIHMCMPLIVRTLFVESNSPPALDTIVLALNLLSLNTN